MKYLILTNDENSQSNRRIYEEFLKLGHECEIKNPQNFVPFISDVTGRDRLYYRTDDSDKSERLIAKNYQGVVTRVGGSGFEFAMYILRHFENLGIFVSCPAFAAENCTDKFRTSQLLSRAKVPVPRQNLSWFAQNPEELINMVDKTFPVWVKQVRGSRGQGVFQLTEAVSANQIMESFRAIPLVIQKDVNKNKVGKRSDIRVLVVGPETDNPQLVAYERISESKDTRSNYSIHKSGRAIELNEIERNDAIKAARAVGAGVCGVDFIRDEQPDSTTKGKTFCIEVNQNLGLTGIQAVTGKNCAQIIAEYVVKQSGRQKPNRPFWDMAAATAFDIAPQPEAIHNSSKSFTLIEKAKNYLSKNTQKDQNTMETNNLEKIRAARVELEKMLDRLSNHPTSGNDAVSEARAKIRQQLETARELEKQEYDKKLRANDPGIKFMETFNRVRNEY